jgi:RNA:NAD 2'-phosphotransferase (TPT1/KptA family)/GNAT superfamily N-acetyltransferase/2'-5' RNA ligase/8-oxo-dGTP pyrophosphatase MutT (NUDIX family)
MNPLLQMKTAAFSSVREINISEDQGSAEGYTADTSAEQLQNWLDRFGYTNEEFVADLRKKYDSFAVLNNINVYEDSRGKGYGDYLLQEFLREAGDHGAGICLLVADTAEEQAKGFSLVEWYERNDFEQIASVYGGELMILGIMNPKIVAKKAAADIGQMKNIVAEMMSVLTAGLPQPEVKIINQTNRTLGQCRWLWGKKADQTWGDDNTTLEIQKKVLGHEETLRRVIAHELCHHEVALLVAKPKLLEIGYETYKRYQNIFGPDGHGKEWKEVAKRFDAKYGADFVTEKSDKDTVVDEQGKEIFILLNNYVYGRHKQRLGWQWAVGLSRQAMAYLDGIDWTSGEFKLVKTTDAVFTKGRGRIKQYTGWNLPRTPEQEQKLQDLWANAPMAKFGADEDKTAKSGPHKNATSQINLPPEAAAGMMEAAKQIPDEELGKDGREDDPHITVKYGVKPDPDLLSQVVGEQQPFTVTLGKTHVFSVSESSDAQAPIVVQCHAPELEALHNKVAEAIGTRKDDFPYVPHVTLAYVKPDVAAKYEGMDWAEGISFQVDAITLSTKGGGQVRVPFGKPRKSASHKTPPMSDTQYQNPEMGEETNAYADIPERVKGVEDLPSLESLSPDLFKTGAGSVHDLDLQDVVAWGGSLSEAQGDWNKIRAEAAERVKAEGKDWEKMPEAEQEVWLDKIGWEWLGATWEVTMNRLQSLKFPLVVYRGLGSVSLKEINKGQYKEKGTGIYWSYDENNAYVHEELAAGHSHIIMLRGVVSSPKQIDWIRTAYVNLVASDEKEINIWPGEEVQITGYKYKGEKAWKNPPKNLRQVRAAATNFKPMLFDNWCDANPMYQPDDFNEAEYRYDENVAHFSTVDFPITIYRAVQVEQGTQPNLEKAGIYWTWVENSADAYFGSGSIWDQGGPHPKNPQTLILKAKVLRSTDVDWDATLLANMLNEDENEITVEAGAQLQLIGIDYGQGYKKPAQKRVMAYGDESKNLPLRGQKGVGGQDFPLMFDPPLFSDEKEAAGRPKFYHGTAAENLDDILKNGLKASKDMSSNEWGRSVYLACDAYTAKNYEGHQGKGRGNWVILEIDGNKLHEDLLRPDDYDFRDIFESLPEEEKAKCEGNWAWCDWRISLEHSCQVAYMGDVPPDAIKVVPTPKFSAKINPKLKAWFNGSKVVDDKGQPRIVYHGSKSTWISSFDLGMEGTGTAGSTKWGGIWFTSNQGNASWFADPPEEKVEARTDDVTVYGNDPYYAAITDINGEGIFEVGPHPTEEEAERDGIAQAKMYNEHLGEDTNVQAVYLKIVNPYVTDQIPRDKEFKAARDGGHDGIIAKEVTDGVEVSDVFVVFSPNQVKSATRNVGNYDPNNQSIIAGGSTQLLPDEVELVADIAQSGGGKAFPKLEKEPLFPEDKEKTASATPEIKEEANSLRLEVGGQKIGYIGYRVDQVGKKKFAEISGLEVDKAWRRQGWGTKLYEALAAKAKREGISFLTSNLSGMTSSDAEGVWSHLIGKGYNIEEVASEDSETGKPYFKWKVAKQYGPVYHGTYHEWSDKIQNDKYKIGKFFSSDPLVAQAYGSFVHECYLTMNKPFIVDAKGESYSSIPTPEALKRWVASGMDTVDTDNIADYASKHGYDGVIIKNVVELHHQVEADDYIVFKPNQIKVKGVIEPEISPYTANKYHKQELQRRFEKKYPQTASSHTAAGLPSFNAWVKKNGGIAKILDMYDVDTAETYGSGLEEPENQADVKRYEKELHKRALADFQERYEHFIAEYQSWQFPMDVFRCISLPKPDSNAGQQHLFPDTPQAQFQQGLQAIKYNGVGIFWSWDENSAECHWGSGGPNVTLHGIINKDNVDWEGTLYANMFPALGDDEKEVRLIEGTQFELEGIQYDEKSGWSQPPVKTVTAAKAKKRVFYHATSAANINGIAQHGLKPSEKTNWGGMLGDSSLGKTFFAKTPASAMYYAMIIFRDKLEDNGQAHVPICLRVTIPEKVQLDTERAQNVQRGVHLPESEAYAPDEESWVTEGIPPANIQMFWQGKWQPVKSGDWDSMFYYEEGEGVGYVDWEGSPVGDSVPEAMADVESFTMPKKAGVMGQVYLLHFDIDPKEEIPSTREDAKKPFHARHYMGWAENAQERIDQHYKATSGVKLIEAIHAKGISFTVARIWDNVDRDFERRMKNQGGLNRHCPICKKLGLIPASRYRGKALEKQVAPATPEAGLDFVEIEKKAAAGDLANLRNYLTLSRREMGEELARNFSSYWSEFVENEHPELANLIDEDGYTDNFDTVPEDVLSDFLDQYGSRALQDDPAMAPTFLTVDYRRDVKNAWLVHFTDFPDEIAKSGFKYGMDRVETLALTTYFKEDAKKFGGYNFALDAHHRNLESLGSNYGKHCVLFQANGIETWHTGDDFEQIIFWGKDARNIIPIYDSGGYGTWSVGEDKDGNPLFESEDLSQVVEWAITNSAKLLPKAKKPKAQRAVASEMTTLYHRTRPGREGQIDTQGLSHIEGGGELWFTDDPSAYYGDSPNAMYSVEVPKEEAEAAHVGGHDYRFMGRSFAPEQIKKVGAEPWEMRQDEYAGRWNEQETEEQSGVRHQKNQDWEQNSLAALSLGKITPEQAKERGVYEAKSFIPLPQTPLYHVTTAKSQVEANGLKTRRELGQNYGKGLGGGTSMSISFTDDMSIAQGIYDNLLIARKVAAGEMTLDDLISTATKGMGANRPWIDDILKSLGGSNPKDKINVELDAIQRGVAFEHGLGRPPDDEAILPQYRKPGPWRPTPWSQHWKGGDGEEKYTYWERDLTPEEKQERVFEFFKKWSFWREQAGGGLDPLYFMSDPKALGQTPESEITILTFKAVPGAMGTRESALGEWRVYTGAAVQLTGNAAAAKMGMFNPNRANVQYNSEKGTGEWEGWNIDFSADPVKEHMLPASFVRKLKGIEQKFINVADVVETQSEHWTKSERVDEIHTQMETEKWFEAILVDEYEDQQGKYYLEEGHHRTRVAKKMGKTTIPAVIMKLEPRKPHWSLSSGIVRKSSDIAKFAFLIEVPKESRGHFWDEPPAHNLEFWAFRSRPPVLMNEKVYFTFDKMPVAETTCLKIEKPGESLCELSGKYEDHWKLYWEPKQFVKYAGATVTLYHGTCPENATALVEKGWQPNQVSSGANRGQSKYLYLTNMTDNARWFAQEHGCDTLIEVRNIPLSYIALDPEDATQDTVEAELDYNGTGLPGTVVLTQPLGAEHFHVLHGKVGSLNEKRNEKWIYHPDYGAFSQKGSIGPHATLIARTMGEGMASGWKYTEVLRGYAVIDVDQKTVTLATPTKEFIPNDVVDLFKKKYPQYDLSIPAESKAVGVTAAMPKKWYHGTSLKNAEKILKDGYLQPDQETTYDIDIPRDGAVYIADFDIAEQYAIERSGVVLEVAAPDISKLLPDEDDVYELLNDRGGELNAKGSAQAKRVKALWLKQWNDENASYNEPEKFPIYKNFEEAWKAWGEIEFEGSAELAEQMKYLTDYIVKNDPKLARAIIELAGKAAHIGPLKVVRQVKTGAPKSIWYHGSSLKNLQSIMSQGLVPEGKEKVWGDDPDAGLSAPSRQSYGGIYVTQNLMTATGAPNTEDKKARGGVLIVAMELQPNTMYLDEDNVTGVLGAPIKHLSDNTFHVLCYYLAATQEGAAETWQQEIEGMRADYIRKCLTQWESKFAERKIPFHPELKKELEKILPSVWLAGVTRAAGHVKDNYSYIRAWDQVFYGTPKEKQRPDANTVLPDASEGEAAFREAAEKVTRTLRLLARPAEESSKNQIYNMNTSRVNEPIGFSGSNHILALIEVRDRQQPAQMILHWGTIPPDFFTQWNIKFGSKYEVVDARKGQPKARGVAASAKTADDYAADYDQEVFYHATTWKIADLIDKEGLKSSDNQLTQGKKYIWCSIDMAAAKTYGRYFSQDEDNEQFAVVEFIWNYDKSEPDPEHFEEGDTYRRIESDIPRSAITKIYYFAHDQVVKTAAVEDKIKVTTAPDGRITAKHVDGSASGTVEDREGLAKWFDWNTLPRGGAGIYDKAFVLGTVTVKVSCRRTGLGRALIGAVLDAAKAQGAQVCFLLAHSLTGLSAKELSAFYSSLGFQPYVIDPPPRWFDSSTAGIFMKKLAGVAKLAAMNRISQQDAVDRKMFGPVYHGTTEEKQENIGNEGFKVYIGDAGSGDVAHGYEGNQPYHDGIPAPVHHLGYGVYFTTAKAIAKQFAGGTTRGMKTYYLDVPRLETINFGVPKTMMKWWVSQGYDGALAKKDRVAATKQMTEHLKAQFDAVWFKGKGMYKLLDGDQICVFDSSRIYEVDAAMSKPGDIGSKVIRKADGMKGVIKNIRPIPPEVAQQYHGGADKFYEIKWTKGGTDHNVYARDIDFVGAKAQGATASMKTAEGFNDEGFWAGEGNAASGVLPICTTTGRICLAWRSPDVHIGNCWGTIGGAVKPEMSLSESAKAELKEETGFGGGVTMIPAYVFSSGSFSYHNFLGTVGTEFRFAPQSEHHWETTGLEWFTWDEIQQMVKENSSDFHPGLISLFKSDGKKIEQLLGKPKTAAGDDGDMPNMLQVFPERPDVMETFRHMRPFERDRLIEEAQIEEIHPADLKTNQATLSRKDLQYFLDNPEEITKPHSNVGLSDTEQLYPLVCRTSEGDWLYDGNHRANAAMKLGIMLKCKVVDLRDYEEPQGKVSRKLAARGEVGPVYHGTDKKFDKFEQKPGTRYILFSEIKVQAGGFFFTDDPEEAKEFGSNVMTCYLKMKKPLIRQEDQYNLSKKQIADLTYICEPCMSDGYSDLQGNSVKTIELGAFAIDVDPEGNWLNEIVKQNGLDWNILDNQEAVNRMKERGYDSTMVDEYNGKYSYCVFSTDQIRVSGGKTASGWKDEGLLNESDMKKWKQYWDGQGHSIQVDKAHGGLYHCWIKFAAAPARALKLYHVTTVPIAEDIKAHGFKPVDQGVWKNYYAPQGRDGIYFYDDLKYSEAYAAYTEGQLYTRNIQPDRPWSENKKHLPQMAIIEVQVPEGVAITTDQKEDGFFVPTADLDKVKIVSMNKYDYVPANGRKPGEKFGAAFPTFEQVMDESTLSMTNEFMFGPDEECKRWYDQALAFWKSQKFPLTIYRGMAVFEKSHEIDYNTFGWSWSLDKKFAQNFAEDKYIDYPDEHHIEVFEGKVTAFAVDWLNTFRAWVTIPEEKEVRLKPKAKVQIPSLKRTVTAADKPRSKYDKVCYAIATDDQLWGYFAEYVQCSDAFENHPEASGRVVDLVKSIPPFVPPTTRKCLYRGEEIRMGDDRLPAKWEPHLRDLLSWSAAYDTAKGFSGGHRGIVWQTVGKIQGIALEDIVLWRNRTHPDESNYSGMQSEWFVMNTCNAKEATPPSAQPARSYVTAAADGFLYHGMSMTDYNRAMNADGILPEPSWWGTAEIAEYYAETAAEEIGPEEEYKIIKLPLSAFNPSLLEADQNSVAEPLTYTLGRSEDELYEEWQNCKGTWEDSLRIYGSVVYNAPIEVTAQTVPSS